MVERMRLLTALILLFLVGGCDSTGISPVEAQDRVDLSRPWNTAHPEAVGLSEAAVAAAVDRAQAESRIQSLLVVKDGYLVVEQYFGGSDEGSLFDVRSVTKGVVGALTGIALQDGILDSLDQPVGPLLRGVAEQVPARFDSVTVRHLLQMTSGLEWPENNGDAFQRWMASGNLIQFVLDQPFSDAPGARFNYNSGTVHLLGVVLQEAYGRGLEEFARDRLFSPLGISRVSWEAAGTRFVNGGTGIDLRAQDLARWGQLFLQEGASGDRQVVPEAWIHFAAEPAFSWRSTYGSLKDYTYGGLWWTTSGGAYLSWGWGGQFVYVEPARRLVVVLTTDWRQVGGEGPGPLTREALSIIIDEIAAGATG